MPVSTQIPGLSPAIDYTARTFAVLYQRALDFLNTRVGSYRYGSFIATDIAPGMLAVLSWFHEQSAYYYNRTQRQSLLELADTPEAMSVLTLAQGYRMRPATAASVAVQATVTPPQPVPITLRAGTKVSTGTINFEVATDAVIPAGAGVWPDGTTSDLIVLVEGTTRTDTFVSNGTAFQKFPLSQPNTIDGSVVVTIINEKWNEVASLVFVEGDQRGRDTFAGTGADGQTYNLSLLYALIDPTDEDAPVLIVTPAGKTQADASKWQQVTAFTGAPKEYIVSQAVNGTTTIAFGLASAGAAPGLGDTIDILYLISGSQKRYQLTYDAAQTGTIRFGDGAMGVIPPSGATITVTYRTGGGLVGNVPEGTIDTSIQGFFPNGQKIGVSIVNAEAGSGGEKPETVDHARFFAPKYAISNQRAVRRDDWTTLAATYSDPLYGAPAHASASLKQAVPELNTVKMAVWGRDQNGELTTAGSPLKLGIQNFLNSRRTITTQVEMADGRVATVDIAADITLEVGAVRQDVFNAVITSIQNFFTSTEVLPGVDLSISKLYSAIQDTTGVDSATLTSVTISVALDITLGIGDGVASLFSGQFALQDGTAIIPSSVVVTDGIQQAVDNGIGGFTGNVAAPPIPIGHPGNSFNYTNGQISIQFTNPPVIGASITAEARQQLFFANVEQLGNSDGTIQTLNSATDYYPVLRREPRGMWSGDKHAIVDAFQVTTTAAMRGTLPTGIEPGTLIITDSTGSPQVVHDNGIGGLLQGFVPVGTVSYSTGAVSFTWLAPPTKTISATWTTRTVDLFIDADLLPLTPGRVFIWGGFDVDGTQPGAPLVAYDDGAGNIAGNVLVGGTIEYDNGHIVFTWNVDPPPGPAGGASAVGTLSPAPDGATTTFNFTTGQNFSPGALNGVGRTRFQFSDLSRPGVTLADGFDNWQGVIDGPSIDRKASNTFNYAGGFGTITFLTPPAASAPSTFAIRVTNVAVVLYSSFVFYVKTPSGPGYDAALFVDNNGRFWGPPGEGPENLYPIDQLDFLRGRYHAKLASGLIPNGRPMVLTYDAIQGVPPALDVVIEGDQIAAPGRISLTEKPPQIFATQG